MISMDHIAEDVNNLPVMNEVVVRLLDMLNDPDISIKEVVELINLDQGLTTNVLKLCNSAYFGLPRKIESISNAAVLMGTKILYELVLTTIAGKYLNDENKGYDLQKGDLWRYSVGSALATEMLLERFPTVEKSRAYTAALLQDIGKVLIDNYLADSYHQVEYLMKEKSISFIEAEKEALGLDHAEVGGWMLDYWKFPEDIAQAVTYHHSSADNPVSRELSEIIHLADLLVMSIGVGLGADGLAYPLDSDLFRQYGLTVEDVSRMNIVLLDKIKQAENLIKQGIGGSLQE